MQMHKPVGASLTILEIGAGAGCLIVIKINIIHELTVNLSKVILTLGPNLRYFPKGTQLSVVDPNPAFLDVIQKNLKKVSQSCKYLKTI